MKLHGIKLTVADINVTATFITRVNCSKNIYTNGYYYGF